MAGEEDETARPSRDWHAKLITDEFPYSIMYGPNNIYLY